MDYCVVWVTVPKEKEAHKLTKLVLAHKLCACVNVIKGIESFFWWEQKITRAAETLLVMKTKRSLLPRLMKAVRSAHSYGVPEIIALPIAAGSKDYLTWIDASCRKGGNKR